MHAASISFQVAAQRYINIALSTTKNELLLREFYEMAFNMHKLHSLTDYHSVGHLHNVNVTAVVVYTRITLVT